MLLLLLVVSAAAGYGWRWRSGWLEQSQDGPILAASQRYGVDPALVKALVWRESRFNPKARGRAGEIGLMQVQEEAAREWADAEHLRGFDHQQCIDRNTNTLAGTWYLRKLLNRYSQTDDPVPYALADYNAGRGNVLKWTKGEAATNSAAFIDQIGFPGTRNYVRSVIRRYQRYLMAARLRRQTTLSLKAIAARVHLRTSKNANAKLHKHMRGAAANDPSQVPWNLRANECG
jgi:soluble lytic murein transglycosylase